LRFFLCFFSWYTIFYASYDCFFLLFLFPFQKKKKTGTPSGVGCFRSPPLWLKHGDIVECEIESIGTLRNLLVDKSRASTASGAASNGGDGGGLLVDGLTVAPMYVGTYTTDKGHVDGKGKGVYPCALDLKTGEMALGGTPMVTSNPTFLQRSRSGNVLYTISEDDVPSGGQLKSGTARTFEIGGRAIGGTRVQVNFFPPFFVLAYCVFVFYLLPGLVTTRNYPLVVLVVYINLLNLTFFLFFSNRLRRFQRVAPTLATLS
jgi:hypothetical protein